MDNLYSVFGLVLLIIGGILLIYGLKGLLYPVIVYSKVRARCIDKVTEQRGREEVSAMTYGIYRYEYKGTGYTFRDEECNFSSEVGAETDLWVRRLSPDVMNKNMKPAPYVKMYLRFGTGLVIVAGSLFIIGAFQ